MNFPYLYRESYRSPKMPHADRLRQAAVHELIDDGCPNVALSHLLVKCKGEESITQFLEPIHMLSAMLRRW